jgi:hypothetical protein
MLFMRATGEEVGASRSENGIGEESRKNKTYVGNTAPEATTYSTLTGESLHSQAGLASLALHRTLVCNGAATIRQEQLMVASRQNMHQLQMVEV